VEDPVFFAVELQAEFIAEVDIPGGEIGVAAQGIVVIAGNIIDLGAFLGHFEDALNDLEVFFWEIPFPELPDIDEIAVEDKRFGLDVLQVLQEFFGVAAIGAEVGIGEDGNVEFALHEAQFAAKGICVV